MLLRFRPLKIYEAMSSYVIGRWGGVNIRGKKSKGERKSEENYTKTGDKALKMHLFGL